MECEAWWGSGYKECELAGKSSCHGGVKELHDEKKGKSSVNEGPTGIEGCKAKEISRTKRCETNEGSESGKGSE